MSLIPDLAVLLAMLLAVLLPVAAPASTLAPPTLVSTSSWLDDILTAPLGVYALLLLAKRGVA